MGERSREEERAGGRQKEAVREGEKSERARCFSGREERDWNIKGHPLKSCYWSRRQGRCRQRMNTPIQTGNRNKHRGQSPASHGRRVLIGEYPSQPISSKRHMLYFKPPTQNGRSYSRTWIHVQENIRQKYEPQSKHHRKSLSTAWLQRKSHYILSLG